MTISKLLGMSADELDRLTTAELEVYFAPYLNITRPPAPRPEQSSKPLTGKQLMNPASIDAMIAATLKAKGLNPNILLKKK